jgi:hypothetical protein
VLGALSFVLVQTREVVAPDSQGSFGLLTIPFFLISILHVTGASSCVVFQSLLHIVRTAPFPTVSLGEFYPLLCVNFLKHFYDMLPSINKILKQLPGCSMLLYYYSKGDLFSIVQELYCT